MIEPQSQSKPKLMLILDNKDINFASKVRGPFSHNARYVTRDMPMLGSIKMECKRSKVQFIGTSSKKIFELAAGNLEGNYENNIGSVAEFKGLDGENVRMILLPRLCFFFSVSHAQFLINHFLNKLRFGGIFIKDQLDWEFITARNFEQVKNDIETSPICAVDIETSRIDLKITSCSYTWWDSFAGKTKTAVIKCQPEDYPFCITVIRVLNNTSCPKVMQNGRYDSLYFLRFNAPIRNWLYDTYILFHSIYPELPRRLDFISAFTLDNYRYWKDEGGINLYQYNAKDTHNTLWIFFALMKIAEECDLENYKQQFPMVFPCLSCEAEGMLIDEERRVRLSREAQEEVDKKLGRLREVTGDWELNPNSPKQVAVALEKLCGKQVHGTDVKALQKWREAYPKHDEVVDLILGIRQKRKAISTYFETELLDGRLMYALDPAGTETGRMASKSSSFWCGTQIQNIPQYARAMVKAEDGWTFIAVDKSQSESYCTGYLSQEENLITALRDSPDFHCHNASMFFGISFEELWKDGKKLQPIVRTLAKKVNHGANYNMGPGVLLETMGTYYVLQAKKLLKLPEDWSPIKVCEELLKRFDKTYPGIRGRWYGEIVREIASTNKLSLPCVSRTRRTFLRPTKSKSELNAAVAHKPQSLSVALVNKALMAVWKELQLDKYRGKFRIKAQVHDEILSICHKGLEEEIGQAVADIMVIPTKVEGRIMTIPSTIATGEYWNEAHD